MQKSLNEMTCIRGSFSAGNVPRKGYQEVKLIFPNEEISFDLFFQMVVVLPGSSIPRRKSTACVLGKLEIPYQEAICLWEMAIGFL